jgi:tRNA-dihydrouridine synthase A
MMDYTDRYMRYFLRLLSCKTVLYTEMVTAMAITRTKQLDRHLKFDAVQHPVVLQIGGADPEVMAEAAAIAQRYRYDAINVNCGCPSSKVANAGAFGAALMREADLVARICRAMHERVNGTLGVDEIATPITVKSRIGIDDLDSYEFVRDFVGTVGATGVVSHFVVHSRKAILNMNLSAEQNRKIPPINYDVVYRLVQDFPQYSFVLNGQVKTYDEVREHLKRGVAGVMVGRDIVERPFYWANVDSELYGVEDPGLTRREVLEEYCRYLQQVRSTRRVALDRVRSVGIGADGWIFVRVPHSWRRRKVWTTRGQ